LIAAAVALTQIMTGAYHNDLTNDDEAAHFVTAMCALDYVQTAPGSNPVAFAKSYYSHYPKVAFGHWPPAFFGLQAAWYGIAGASPPAGILLVGLIAAAAGIVLFERLRQFFDLWIAALTVGVYLCLPLVRRSSALLMSDMLMGLCTTLAVLAFCDGCAARSWRPWVRAAFWSAVAILTKESALALLLFAPLALLVLGGKARTMPSIVVKFSAGLAALVIFTLVVYQLTGVVQMRGLPSLSGLPPVSERVQFLWSFPAMTPWSVLFVAAIGIIRTAIRRDSQEPITIHMAGAALWLIVWLACQVAFRDGIEDRYFLPAVFPLMILFAAGLVTIAGCVAGDWTPFSPRLRTIAGRAAAMGVAVLCIISMPALRLPRRSGYATVVGALPDVAGRYSVLVSSDPFGEGALIVEALLHDRARNMTVQRASKTLATSGWSGEDYRLIARRPEEVGNFLQSAAVQFIILDAIGFVNAGTRPHHRLLEQTVRAAPDRFRLIADLPLVIDGQPYEGAVQIYENMASGDGHAKSVDVAINSGFGPIVQVRPENALPVANSIGESEAALGRGLRAVATKMAAVLPPVAARRRPFVIEPESDALGPEGGLGEVAIAARPDIGWEAAVSEPWIRITSRPTGSGNGILRYDIAPNDSSMSRLGIISIRDVRYTVHQSSGP
jgi:hypothetical protein